MSFVDHLEVLRWHLVRSVSAIIVVGIVAFLNKRFVFDEIILAPKSIDFFTYKMFCLLSQKLQLGGSFCLEEIPFIVSNIRMTGQFTIHIMVSVVLGIVIASPYLIWEIWRFVKPGLHQSEKKHTTAVVFWTSFLFLIGVLFGYYLITPLSINFLGSYQVSEEVANQITLGSYISTVTMLTLMCGLIFELPLGVYFLSKIGLITPKLMRTYRKHSIVTILVLAAIITPPDVVSQLLISLPLFLLYEISIYISASVVKKSKTVDDD
ncbi:MAG: twin-arginine translocase subunit TatC [Bacteroidetes bacterium]|nr:MAG: twin-arginine translocase subunit TatC [Bacteroidota bacterium]